MRLYHRLLRLLGVVSPSGTYPLPPRWAMSKKGRATWHPAPDAHRWAADVIRGPVSKPSEPLCGPGTDPAGSYACDRCEGRQKGAEGPC